MKIRAWDDEEKTFWTLADAGETSGLGSVQFFGNEVGELQFGRIESIDRGLGFADEFTAFPIDYFSSLTDDLDKEIYAGDIVEVFHLYYWFKGIIKFGEFKEDASAGEYAASKVIGFYVEAINPNELDEDGDEKVRDYIRTASPFDFEKIEVVGNIYENPELLKGGGS